MRNLERRVNRLIAEHVMGWEWVPYIASGGWYDGVDLGHWAHDGRRVKVWDLPGKTPVAATPYFSEDIATAFAAVQVGTPMPGHVGPTMLHMLRGCAGGHWEAQFCSDFGYSEAVTAPTAPLAICLALLKAHKVDVPVEVAA